MSGDSGGVTQATPITVVYRNDGGFPPNSPPTIPGGLSSTVTIDSIVLNWLPSSDNTTPSPGLSYNLQIISRQEKKFVLSPMSDSLSGYRKVPQIGNAGNNLLWYLKNQTPGQYAWTIQAIDNSLAGSPFASEENFLIKGPRFIDSGIGLPLVTDGDVDWVDYDNDQDLDLFVTGNSGSGEFSQLYKNEGFHPDSGWIFREVNSGIQNVRESSTAWGDYDNDGDLDLLISGFIPSMETTFTELYRNEGNDIYIPLLNPVIAQVYVGSSAWGDVDNDGDLDLLLSGYDGLQDLTHLYLNEGPDSLSGWRFTLMNPNIPASESTTTDWGDYDKDGDLDLVFSGWSLDVGQTEFAAIYRNDGKLDDSTWNFVDINAGLPAVADGSTSWGDYDADGDLDLLIVNGSDGLTRVSQIFRNDGDLSGSWRFSPIAAGLPDLQYGEAAWGDYDNDGDLDIAMTGELVNFGIPFSGIFRNDQFDIFTLDTTVTLTDAVFSSLAWGDYDNDGDLDLSIIGSTPIGSSVILQNVGGFSPNQAPEPPSGLSAETFLDSVKLSWLPSQDDSTFDAAICYNLRMGTFPGAADIISPMSDDNTGIRKILNFGNVNHNRSWTIKNLQPGTYYWAVQAIDHSFAGSEFSQESSFEIREPYYNELALNLPGVSGRNIAWCDYDNDNDMDLFISGNSDSGAVVSLYNNGGFSPITGWIFNEIPGIFPNHPSPATSWGDYDNDGDLDLILQGSMQVELYRNDGNNTFNLESTSPFHNLAEGALAWGDMDNDGDLDLIQAGHEGLINIGQYYRNDGIDSSGIWQFTPLNASVRGFSSGFYDLGDFDNDRDLDILWTGFFSGAFASGVLRNDGALDDTSWSFTEIELFSAAGKASWGDYDSDGDLDILLVGFSTQGTMFSIFRNDGVNIGGGWLFFEISLGTGEFLGDDAAWGDYDNDGDLDILMAGSLTGTQIPITYLYRNDGNDIFTRDPLGQFMSAKNGRVSFADFDNDADLDIGLMGFTVDQTGEYRITKIYRNDGGFPANQPPQFPSGLNSETFVDSVLLSWQPATDNSTSSPGLTYNLRLGTSPLNQNIISPMSDPVSGYRRITKLGNVNHNLSWIVKNLTPGNYYWTVQAIDNHFSGSVFTSEETFVVGIPPTIVHTPTDSQSVDSSIVVSARINAPGQVVEANLNYKPGGMIGYLKNVMQIVGNQYIGMIPEEAVTSRGLSYFIEAVDEDGLVSYTDTFSIRVKLEGNGITRNQPQPAGSVQNSYRLISIPLDLDDKNLTAVLEGDLGSYDKTKWRLFEPLPGGGLFEYPNVSEVNPGDAYWLIVAEPNKIIDTGPGKTMNTINSFSYNLLPGWNYIGIPFNFRIPPSALSLGNNQIVDIRSYEGNWNVHTDSLQPFAGYALYAEEETDLLINPDFLDSLGGPGVSIKGIPADYVWYINISARCQLATDPFNYAGMHSKALRKWDEFDRPEVPPMGGYISVSFPHPEWKRKSEQYMSDIRNESNNGEMWEFSVTTNINDRILLTMEKSENFPQVKEIWLIDKYTDFSISLEKFNQYEFYSSGNQTKRNFQLVVGDRAFVQNHLNPDKILPTSFELFQNYPNPFNTSTKIRYAVPLDKTSDVITSYAIELIIYDILGHKVQELVKDVKPAGYYEVEFDASQFASGIYIYQIIARSTLGTTFSQSRKLVFLK
jgi:hypothetical protein